MADCVLLVFNCGSSSVKFEVLVLPQARVLLTGTLDSLGSEHARLVWQVAGGQEHVEACGGLALRAGMLKIIDLLGAMEQVPVLDGVVHRVVHGGAQFTAPTVVNDVVLATLKSLIPLAPLHNPANILGIELARSLFQVPSIAVFDTAFHQSMPEHAYLYPVPWSWLEDYGVRRYGFHGISHAYVSEQVLGQDSSMERGLLSAHLGNGASLAAIVKGACVDTTMGMTPLEGLMMGTRCGSIDPGLLDYLVGKTGQTITQITAVLNGKSGLLGISGVSHDMRLLSERAQQGDERCRLARWMFVYRLAKHVAALVVALPHFSGLIFTGGIGEHDGEVRLQVMQQLHHFGVVADVVANQNCQAPLTLISAEASQVKVWVVKTNESLAMARQAFVCLQALE
jgi:acetate kinase